MGTGGRVGEGIVREFGMDILLYLKWTTNKALLYSTGNPAQCYVAAWMGGELGENGHTYMCGWVPALCTWDYHNVVDQLYPKTNSFKKKKIWVLVALFINLFNDHKGPGLRIEWIRVFICWSPLLYLRCGQFLRELENVLFKVSSSCFYRSGSKTGTLGNQYSFQLLSCYLSLVLKNTH